jgi:hypothetical protein
MLDSADIGSQSVDSYRASGGEGAVEALATLATPLRRATATELPHQASDLGLRGAKVIDLGNPAFCAWVLGKKGGDAPLGSYTLAATMTTS